MIHTHTCTCIHAHICDLDWRTAPQQKQQHQLRCVEVCGSTQVRCSVLRHVAVFLRVLQCGQTPTAGQRRSRKSGIKSVALQCAGALQSVAVCCSILQCVAVCCSMCRPWLMNSTAAETAASHMLCRSAQVRCRVSQGIAVRCSALQCVAVCCSVLQCVAVCCSVLQCVAECCSVLQRVAVWANLGRRTAPQRKQQHLQQHTVTLNGYRGR